jgi:hypothetical protein
MKESDWKDVKELISDQIARHLNDADHSKPVECEVCGCLISADHHNNLPRLVFVEWPTIPAHWEQENHYFCKVHMPKGEK